MNAYTAVRNALAPTTPRIEHTTRDHAHNITPTEHTILAHEEAFDAIWEDLDKENPEKIHVRHASFVSLLVALVFVLTLVSMILFVTLSAENIALAASCSL